ncbi:hypothetical protein N0V85_003018 [Neurospora sp. IMI 360204]|nr:hypothetical protein N0V85_003018 [Neurospora sp. IMI 360204]
MSTYLTPKSPTAKSGKARAPSQSPELSDSEFLEDAALTASPKSSSGARPAIFSALGLDFGPRVCTPQNTPMAGPQRSMTSETVVAGTPSEGGLQGNSTRAKRRLPAAEIAETYTTNKRVRLSDHNGGEDPAAASDKEATPKREDSLISHPSAVPAPPQQPVLVSRGDETFEFIDLKCGERQQAINTTGRTIDCTVTQGLVRVTLANPMLRVFTLGANAFFQLEEGDVCTVVNAANWGQTAVIFLLGKPVAGGV